MTQNPGLAARPEVQEPDRGGAARPPGRLPRLLLKDGVAALLALAVVVVVGSIAFPAFHTLDNLRYTLLGYSYIGIVAIGMTFVIITGGIDLSVGSVFALGGVVGVFTYNHAGLLAAVAATIVVCGLVGLLNGVLISYAGLAPFIVTLATLFGVRGLVYQLTDAGSKTYSVDGSSSFAQLGTGTLFTFGLPVFIAALAFLAAHLVMERSRFGLHILSVGGAEPAVALMGLPVARIKTATYVLCAALAGVAGMLQAAQLVSASPIIASGYELQAIATVVIGGTLLTGGSGSQMGTAAGVLLLGAINSLIVQLQLDSTWNNVVSGAFLVLVVTLQRLLVTSRRGGRRRRTAAAGPPTADPAAS